MQWVRNGSHHGLSRMVNAVGTEWAKPWVTEDGECSVYGIGQAMGECSGY